MTTDIRAALQARSVRQFRWSVTELRAGINNTGTRETTSKTWKLERNPSVPQMPIYSRLWIFRNRRKILIQKDIDFCADFEKFTIGNKSASVGPKSKVHTGSYATFLLPVILLQAFKSYTGECVKAQINVSLKMRAMKRTNHALFENAETFFVFNLHCSIKKQLQNKQMNRS